MKKDFKKRSNRKAKERKDNSLDLIIKAYSILGTIAIIYMSTYAIVRATKEGTGEKISAHNPTENQIETLSTAQPSLSQAVARRKIWEKSKITADPGPQKLSTMHVVTSAIFQERGKNARKSMLAEYSPLWENTNTNSQAYVGQEFPIVEKHENTCNCKKIRKTVK